MPKIIYGTGGGEDEYSPPLLFPQLRQYIGEERKEYIVQELERMIEEGTLSVTDMLAQPSLIRDNVGLTLKNQFKDPEAWVHRPASEPLPPSITGYMVKIRACDGKRSIKYKAAVVQRSGKSRTIPGAKTGIGNDGDNFTRRVAPNVAKWVDYESPEAEMPLPEAWVCLSQHGKYCRPAKSARTQETYWLYEEVRPTPKKKARDDR